MTTLALCLFLAQPQPEMEEAPAVEMPSNVEEAEAFVMMPDDGQEIGFIKNSIRGIARKWKNKEYGAAIAAMIMLLLAAAHMLMRKLGKSIRKKWMPTISIATGVGVGLAIHLGGLAASAGVGDWLAAIGQGLLVGLGAIGAWEWIGKKLLGKTIEKVGPKPNNP